MSFLFWDPPQVGSIFQLLQDLGGDLGEGPALWEELLHTAPCTAGRLLSSGMCEADLGNPSRQPVTSGRAFDILLLAVPCNEGNQDNTDESLLLFIPSKLAIRVLVWVDTSNKGLHVCVHVYVCVRARACVWGEEKEHLKATFSISQTWSNMEVKSSFNWLPFSSFAL